jgi:hypothetical protein
VIQWWLPDPATVDGETAPRFDMRKHSGSTLDPAWPKAITAVKCQGSTMGEGVILPVR